MVEPRAQPAGAEGACEPRAWLALPLAAAFAYLALTAHAARVETPTVDEFAHVPAGVAIWRHGRTDLYRSNPPLPKLLLAAPVALDPSVSAPPVHETPLLWGPWEYAHRFMHANRSAYLALMARARGVAIAAGLLAGCVVFAWARSAFGLRAAAVVSALFWLCPNVLAHGHLATIDMAGLFTIALAMLALRLAYRRPGALRLLGAGACLGLALATKFLAVLILPAVPLLAAAERWRAAARSRARRLARAAADSALTLAAALVVVGASAGFESAFQPLGDFPLRSRFATGLQAALPGWLPVPLPGEYLLGFDGAKEISEHGEFGSYLLGRWSERGWWYYNLVALGVKLPVAVLALLAAAPFAWASRRSARELGYLLLPLVLLIGGFSAASHLNIGIRHVLPALPFAFLLLGPIFAPAPGRGRERLALALAAGALGASALNAARLHPDYLTFMNAIAGGPARGGDWLLDSNFDWGQDLYRVPAAVTSIAPGEPVHLLYFGHVDPALYGLEYQLLPATPVEGIAAVSENFLRGAAYLTVAPGGAMVGVAGDTAAWLRGYEPVARVGSIRIYDTRGQGSR
jgi:hypothetical protein